MTGRDPRKEIAPATVNAEIMAPGTQLTLLPEAEIAPTLPRPTTLAARLLEMLAAGEAVTHPVFLDRTGSWRASAIAFELTLLGWPIVATRIGAPTTARPDRSIVEYSLARGHALARGAE